jgi:hypothetical protein
MKTIHYILLSDHTTEAIEIMDDNGNIDDEALMLWAELFKDIEKRRIDYNQIDKVDISTVFLGIDHNYTLKGKPILFETMAFDENGDVLSCRRYSTWDDAKAGHLEALKKARIKAGLS